MLVLVMEASTTSGKTMLFDTERGVQNVRVCTYPADIDDHISQDTEGVYQLLVRMGRDMCAARRVDAVALGGTWHNVAVCDSAMRPVTRTQSWLDTSAAQTTARLRADKALAAFVYHATGCMIHSTYAPYKLMHMREQGLDLTDKFVVDQGSYNFFRLTGKRLCTASMASGMGLLNIRNLAYEDAVLKLAGISTEQLGALCGFSDYAGLTAAGAADMGLPQGIPVIPAFPDGALNQLGAGAMDSGIMTISVGTSAAMRTPVHKPATSDCFSTWCYVSAMNTWLSGAATAGACNCVDWVKKQILGDNYSYDQLDGANADVKNMPIFLPFIYGERCPGWDDGRRGGFHALRPSHRGSDLFAGAKEGVLFNIKQCYDILTNLNGRPAEIKVSGGILKSPMWIQMLSDILTEDLSCADMEQCSLVGGAVIAATALGSAVTAKDLPATTVTPDPAAAKTHRERYERYLALYKT